MSSGATETPTFTAVLNEQGHTEETLLARGETHAEFMARHGHDDWLASLEQTAQYERPVGNLPSTKPVQNSESVPVKGKGKR